MKALIQRVKRASVTIEGKLFSSIENGLLVFLGVQKGDTAENADKLAQKLVNLRIFEDENDKMNLSLLDVKGQMLVVSQFTLCGDCKKGTRPSFDNAELPHMSERENEEYNKEQIWEKLPVEKRSATIDNAAAIPIFVGSMTHWSKDSSEIELSDDEKAVFTEMEHVRWCVCSLIRGYRPINLKKINPGDNYWSYYNNLRKQFYNEYICKFDEMKDRQMGLLESELIQFYKQIIFKQL